MNKNYIVQIFKNINTMNICNMIFAHTQKIKISITYLFPFKMVKKTIKYVLYENI